MINNWLIVAGTGAYGNARNLRQSVPMSGGCCVVGDIMVVMPMTAEIITPEALAALVGQSIRRIACELRPDLLDSLYRAAQAEGNQRGRTVLQQLVINAGIAADEQLPLCQDTGYVWVLLEVGEKTAAGQEIAISSSIFRLVDDAVAKAYKAAGLRMSLVRDALTDRSNSNDNTPAFCELYFNPTKQGVTLHVMLKGGGSDNASRVAMLPPGAGLNGVKQVVLDAVCEKGASACPPLVIGVGVGSTFDKVGSLAKRALLRDISQHNPQPELASLERQLLDEVNALGIGAGGLGGDTTALAVSLLTAPCHIAALPVAVNIGCNSLRSLSTDIDAATLESAMASVVEMAAPATADAAVPAAGLPGADAAAGGIAVPNAAAGDIAAPDVAGTAV